MPDRTQNGGESETRIAAWEDDGGAAVKPAMIGDTRTDSVRARDAGYLPKLPPLRPQVGPPPATLTASSQQLRSHSKESSHGKTDCL